jgi:signal transduction histidine kinase
VQVGLRRWAQLPPLAQDALLTVVLFWATFGPGRLEGALGLLLQAALLLPLVWRRRAPLAVFCAIGVVAFGQWLLDVQLPADVALLVALYTVAAHSSWHRTLLAGSVLGAGSVLAAARWAAPGQFLAASAVMAAMIVAAAALGTNQRTKRALLATTRDRALQLERERDQQARLAVAEERARISREMHDIVSHNLSVIVALADATVYTRRNSPDSTTATMDQISGIGRQAMTDLRRSLGVLRADEPDALSHPMPGIAELEALADQMRAAGLVTQLDVRGCDPAPIAAAAQLTVYRLVQEALTNTLKHAPGGTRAEVRVRCSPRTVTVDVTDDGRTSVGHERANGHGISGMRERTAAYCGDLQAGPLAGGGWRVFARLDLDAAGDGAR